MSEQIPATIDGAISTLKSSDKEEHFRHARLDLHLKGVRLLRLLPKPNGSTQVQVELQHADLRNAPKFKALSYTWGPPDPTFNIIVNGQSFPVRQNLYTFFKAVQLDPKYNTDTWLWIDQVCIDQSDVLERNHQVGQMSEIYRSASKVIIWLGPTRRHCDVTVRRLSRDSSQSALQSRDHRYLLEDTLIQLLQCDYWFRTWIIQEFLLATSLVVYWGKTRLSMHVVENLVRSRSHVLARHCQIDSLRAKINQICYLTHRRKLKDQESFLIHQWSDALSLSQMTRCVDIRDRIYALQGLLHPTITVKADYSAAPQDVLKSVLIIVAMQETYPSSARFCEKFAITRIQLGNALGFVSQPYWHEEIRNILLDRLFNKPSDFRIQPERQPYYVPSSIGPRGYRIPVEKQLKQMVIEKFKGWIQTDLTSRSNELPGWYARYHGSLALFYEVLTRPHVSDRKWEQEVIHLLRDEFMDMMKRNTRGVEDSVREEWEKSSTTFFEDVEARQHFDVVSEPQFPSSWDSDLADNIPSPKPTAQ